MYLSLSFFSIYLNIIKQQAGIAYFLLSNERILPGVPILYFRLLS